jgi:hypothetical protein
MRRVEVEQTRAERRGWKMPARFLGTGFAWPAFPLHFVVTNMLCRQGQSFDKTPGTDKLLLKRNSAANAPATLGYPQSQRSGEGEIRTPATLAGRPVFETGAFNHSATSPDGGQSIRRVNFSVKAGWQGANSTATPITAKRSRAAKERAMLRVLHWSLESNGGDYFQPSFQVRTTLPDRPARMTSKPFSKSV